MKHFRPKQKGYDRNAGKPWRIDISFMYGDADAYVQCTFAFKTEEELYDALNIINRRGNSKSPFDQDFDWETATDIEAYIYDNWPRNDDCFFGPAKFSGIIEIYLMSASGDARYLLELAE